MTYQARFMRHDIMRHDINDINFTGFRSYKHKQTIRSKNKTNMPYRQKMSEYSSIGTYTSDPGWNRYRAGKFHLYNMKNHSAKSMSNYCKVSNNAEFT